MGTEYYIGCQECHIYRNLDKNMEQVFDWFVDPPKDREAALEMARIIEKNPFRYALLLAFMIEHKNHNGICFFSEHAIGPEDWREGNTDDEVDGVMMKDENRGYWSYFWNREEDE